VPGWTSTLLLISVLSGMQFLLIGICGEYLYRIYSEVVRRPLVLVSDRTKGDQPS
jgi:dolichol-phosphate mannosyltransferase